MPHSFTLNRDVFPTPTPPDRTGRPRRKVLITGAAGSIGTGYAAHAAATYDLRLMVRPTDPADRVDAIATFGDVVTAELSDLPRLIELFAGIDTVVHLAADPDPNATWASLLPNNIVGTYNAMAAAKAAGCRRVVYASSIHAVGGYGPEVQVKTSEPPNPGDLYGVTKCFGEALGRYMAEQEGLSVIALRIGAFQPLDSARDAEQGVKMMSMFVSRRDLNQLIEKCIDAENLRFAILHGVSDNHFKRLDISDARELVGYAPQDDATATLPELAPMNLRKGLMTHSMKDSWAKSGVREDV